MPSKKQYNLVNDDAYDSRIPLHSEEAFQHGINFHAKYIGTLDVPRPNSRVEIVAAMRRIRYEFKAKSIKKKKVTITISVEGVKVIIRKKKKKSQWQWDDSRFLVMHHPIYRIFYVSHDSQDLKIFSYIARDGGSNVFKCNVFKSSKKSQAMRIVRTVGQAFEVCHKLSLAHATSMSGGSPEEEEEEEEESLSEKGSSMLDATDPNNTKSKVDGVHDPTSNHLNNNNNNNNPSPVKDLRPAGKVEPLAPPVNPPSSKNATEVGETYSSPHSGAPLPLSGAVLPEGTPLSVHHQLQLLREQLEQQTQQSQAIDAQLHLLKDQLAAETTARMDAQAQNSHLLSHNRELLEHIRVLVRHIQDLERKLAVDRPTPTDPTLDFAKASLTENSSGTTTPSPASLHLPADVCPSDVSPTLSRSVSASANPGSQDVWLQRSTNSSSTPSTLGHHQGLNKGPPGAPSPLNSPRMAGPGPRQQQEDGFPLSLPSSPTPASMASNLEELLKQSALRINSTGSQSTATRQQQELSVLSPLPRLNPPPQKAKVAKTVSNLDLPPGTPVGSYNSPVSRSSSTSSSWTDSVLPPSLDSVRSEVLSWPPSTQANALLRQYSLPSSQHSVPNTVGNSSDNFVSQALKDLTKLNLFDNNRELLRGIESHLNTHTDTLNKS